MVTLGVDMLLVESENDKDGVNSDNVSERVRVSVGVKADFETDFVLALFPKMQVTLISTGGPLIL